MERKWGITLTAHLSRLQKRRKRRKRGRKTLIAGLMTGKRLKQKKKAIVVAKTRTKIQKVAIQVAAIMIQMATIKELPRREILHGGKVVCSPQDRCRYIQHNQMRKM